MQGDDARHTASARHPRPVHPRPAPDAERRAADEQLLKHLAQQGFKGRDYDRFQNELAAYGVSVLRAWMHTGDVFDLVNRHGYSLKPTEAELEALHRDSDLREELAGMTVACALPRFRKHALVEGGWTYDGGATLTTYFMGACLRAFPNEYRRHQATENRNRQAALRLRRLRGLESSAPSAEDRVLQMQSVREHLRGITNPRTLKAVAALIVGDYTQEEIQELLEAPSTRAVEGILHRWRTTTKRSERERRHG